MEHFASAKVDELRADTFINQFTFPASPFSKAVYPNVWKWWAQSTLGWNSKKAIGFFGNWATGPSLFSRRGTRDSEMRWSYGRGYERWHSLNTCHGSASIPIPQWVAPNNVHYTPPLPYYMSIRKLVLNDVYNCSLWNTTCLHPFTGQSKQTARKCRTGLF